MAMWIHKGGGGQTSLRIKANNLKKLCSNGKPSPDYCLCKPLPAITPSKLTTETLELGVKYAQS